MNKEMWEEVARISAQAAVQTTIQYLENEKKIQEKNRTDWRLRNTKLLLKNYRSFSLHCADLEKEVSILNKEEVVDSLDSDDFAVEAIKRSKQRTITMVNFINQMLEVYEIMCERSGRAEEMRRYQTIYHLYISDERLTAEEVADCHKTNVRTVYRDANEAVKTLSILVFGVDGIKLNK